jgi:hypothetical protein
VATLPTPPPSLPTANRAIPETRRKKRFDAPAALRLWHLASLDAPTVAIVWTLAFAWAARIQLPDWVVAVVALAALCFYIADRLLDARNANTPLRERHHFHWTHRRVFLPAAIAAAVGALALVGRSMPLAARERNSVLAAAALAYFTSVHSPWRIPVRKLCFPKELLVGILFTLACAAPTLSCITGPGASSRFLAMLPAMLVFMALAWLNCYAIECWESRSHRAPRIFRFALALVAIAVLTASAEIGDHYPRPAALLAAAALSATLLALLDLRQQKFTPIALRIGADLALLTPLALFAFHAFARASGVVSHI